MDISLLFKFPGILILVGIVLLIIAIIIGIIAYKTPVEDDEIETEEDEKQDRIVIDSDSSAFFDENSSTSINNSSKSNNESSSLIQEKEPAPISGLMIKNNPNSYKFNEITANNKSSEKRVEFKSDFTEVKTDSLVEPKIKEMPKIDEKPKENATIKENKELKETETVQSNEKPKEIVISASDGEQKTLVEPTVTETNAKDVIEKVTVPVTEKEVKKESISNKNILKDNAKNNIIIDPETGEEVSFAPADVDIDEFEKTFTKEEKPQNQVEEIVKTPKTENKKMLVLDDLDDKEDKQTFEIEEKPQKQTEEIIQLPKVENKKMLVLDEKEIEKTAKNIREKTKIDVDTVVEPEFEEEIESTKSPNETKSLFDEETQNDDDKLTLETEKANYNESIFNDNDFIKEKDEFYRDYENYKDKPIYGGIKPSDNIDLAFTDDVEKPLYKSKFEDTDQVPRIITDSKENDNVEML